MLVRKRFGQHFLHDTGVLDRIVSCVRARPGDLLIEIGPGQGALTRRLLALGYPLIAIEIDRDLVRQLQQEFATSPLTLIEQDVLQVDFERWNTGSPTIRLIGNLPYNISTPLIFHLLKHRALIKDMHFMLQKEVVDRLAASVGDKNYGRLSVMIQCYYSVDPLFTVKPGAFTPPPKVQSAVVRLQPLSTPKVPEHAIGAFSAVVKQAFNQRRKTLKNSLQTLIPEDAWGLSGIDPQLRPEQLSVEDFARLSQVTTGHPQ